MYTYCDVRDAARATYLAATTSLPSGSHTVAFIAARDTFVNTPSAEIVKRYFPTAEIRGLTGYNRLVSGCAAERRAGMSRLAFRHG